jgi:2-polyprenyl-6-methoxyphenol hydroxylase-like FAD-dependent oxidoreductase
VKLYEQSRFANEIGAAVNITPNSNGILRRWGIYAEEFGANPINHMIQYAKDGRVLQNFDLREPNKRWQHPWLLVHRANLHSHLKKLATSLEGEGAPAKLHTASKVVEIDPDKGTLTLENGETITADVIVGADGVYVNTYPVKQRHLYRPCIFANLEPVSDEKVHPRRKATQHRKGCLSLSHSAVTCRS